MSELRVLLVAAANSTTGGGERHVADLLRTLPQRGAAVGLVCPAGGDLGPLAQSQEVPVFLAPVAAGLSAAGIAAVRRAAAAFAPDVVHAHGSRAAFFTRVADSQAAKRVVYTLHGIHIDKAGSRGRQVALAAIERTLARRTARFVCVCASDVAKGAQLGILDARRTTVVHNGIAGPESTVARGSFRAELGLDAQVPLALSIGRFHEQKDQRTLLDAWAIVRDRMPGAVLALIGSGELEAALRERAVALRLGESVRFVVPRDELGAAYVDANVFALSSRWEGLPYVVLEAMAYGLPVVSTSVDGIPEAVQDGVSGQLVPPADADALADALVTLLADRELAVAMGSSAAERMATEFTLDAMSDGCMAVYRDVVR